MRAGKRFGYQRLRVKSESGNNEIARSILNDMSQNESIYDSEYYAPGLDRLTASESV